MIVHVGWRLTRRAFLNLWRAPLPSLVAVLTISLALFIGATFGAAIVGARGLLAAWGAEASVTLYLDRATTDAQAQDLAAQLRKQSLEATYVTKAQALERLRVDLGELGGTLDGLAQNPLPPTLELRPTQPLAPVEMRALAQRLGKLPQVTDVDYGREWLDRLEALGRALRAAGAGALALVLGAAVLVVANTIRLAVYARRDEIEIMKLVGATDRYVRTPFLVEGAMQGLLGAACALVALLAVQHWLFPKAVAAFSFASGLTHVAVHAPEAFALLGFGAFVGLLGSWVAVGRFLRT